MTVTNSSLVISTNLFATEGVPTPSLVRKGENKMDINKLNCAIKKFWQSEGYNEIYYMGVCSEVAVALKKFLGEGTIVKRGLMHTALKYKDYYCDIRGCMTPQQFKTRVPGEYLRPATPKEIQHINSLLEHHTVKKILNGLKKFSGGCK